MSTFFYTGEDANGKKVSMKVEAKDRFEVYEIARKDGNTVTEIEEGKGFSIAQHFDMEKINYYLSRIKQDELVMMTRNLGSMLVAGLPLSRALSVIERQSNNPRLKGVVKQVQARITQGDQFNEALREFPKTFDDLYVSMVRAGEESGGLADSLETLSLQMERSSSLKKRIKGAMIYPSIVLSVMVIIGVLMMIFVMPSITATFKSLGGNLPAMTRILIGVSDFMVKHTIATLGGIVLAVALTIYALRTKYGKICSSFVIIRLPIIGNIAKEANAARTARTLSSLLSSGVDVIRSIQITRDVLQNVFYKEMLALTAQQVEKGGQLSESFIAHPELYPVLVGEMISVGEETGQIAKMLKELALFYEGEVEHKTSDLSTIIEPLLMVVIGGAVGFFALAMIAPIYSIADSIK